MDMANKYYYKTNRGYHVMRRINGKMTCFGYYPSESIAQYVVSELHKLGWKKYNLKGIQQRVMKNEWDNISHS